MTTGKYPHDRIVFFSDAVFAIAITLLVIEIKVPTHKNIEEIGMAASLQHLTPLFIGYFVSFVVAALFWKSHLVVCKYVQEFDSKLIWINTFLLLFVALMPFSTGLYSENFGNNVAFSFYCLNVAAIGFTSYILHAVVVKRYSIAHGKWFKNRVLVAPLIFLFSIVLAFVSPLLSRIAFVLIFIIQIVGDRYHKKKYGESI